VAGLGLNFDGRLWAFRYLIVGSGFGKGGGEGGWDADGLEMGLPLVEVEPVDEEFVLAGQGVAENVDLLFTGELNPPVMEPDDLAAAFNGLARLVDIDLPPHRKGVLLAKKVDLPKVLLPVELDDPRFVPEIIETPAPGNSKLGRKLLLQLFKDRGHLLLAF
jgi:hypothetical protein